MEEQADPRLIPPEAEPGITPLSDDFDWPLATEKNDGADSRFIDLLGPLAAYRFFVHLGGSRTYVPRKLSEAKALVAVIGEAGLQRLIDAQYGGTFIKVPLCREWRVLVLRRQGYSYAEIATRLVVSQNKIWGILSNFGGLYAPFDREAAARRGAARRSSRQGAEDTGNSVVKSDQSIYQNENKQLQGGLDQIASFGDLIGEVEATRQIGDLIDSARDESGGPPLELTRAERFARWRAEKLGGAPDPVPSRSQP